MNVQSERLMSQRQELHFTSAIAAQGAAAPSGSRRSSKDQTHSHH
jgi:hypothetical protein